jgi:phosphoribosylamine--glycine ligase
VVHAGTRLLDDGTLVTAGGRVLCCTGVAATIDEARARAYDLVRAVHIDGATYRSDIAAL